MTAYQVMPGLTAEEYADLRDDIAANGVRVPIDVDENGQVLDGHHRALIAAELGIECPRRVLAGLSEDEKVAHAYAVNIQRRSLTREQKRALVAASLARDPHLSDREHAKRTGVSPTTAGSVREELEQSGQVSKLDTSTGADGKSYPKPQPTRPATWVCHCGQHFKSEHTHCSTCGFHYPAPQHCPTHTVSVDTETGEILDSATIAGRAAADRAADAIDAVLSADDGLRQLRLMKAVTASLLHFPPVGLDPAEAADLPFEPTEIAAFKRAKADFDQWFDRFMQARSSGLRVLSGGRA